MAISLDSVLFAAVVITSVPGTNAITVIRESYGGVEEPDAGMNMQGVLITSHLTPYLGFSDSWLPQPGSRVLCASDAGGTCFILGVIPVSTYKFKSMMGRTMLGAGSTRAEESNAKGHEKHTPAIYDMARPADVVDGEYVVSNEFGVLLGLYQQLANLKGSELSQIQCHLIDDLVRVISHNYQHYSATGEHNIYHDGKSIMVEYGSTHMPAEGYGCPAVNSESGSGTSIQKDGPPTVDDSSDFYKISGNEQLKAIERLKIFSGRLGDFLNLFVVKPDDQEQRYLDPGKRPSKPDSGLSNIRLATDGGMHFRSVKEIFLEKTQWIRVPLRTCAPDDPNGDDAESISYETKDPFEFNNSYSYKGNPFNYSLQLRDYAAYVDEKLAYKNFKTHEKDFYVNDDIGKEKPLGSISKVDPQTPLKLAPYVLRTAGIYLMPNGGITLRDAWNSAIVMEGGNIYLQPSKDLLSQPMRHAITKAGGSVNIACKKHMDLSSTEEGLRMKTEKSQYLFSENGGIVLQSRGSADNTGVPDPAEKAIDTIGGIVFKAKLGIYSYAEKDIVGYAKRKILFHSLANTDIVADTQLVAYGKRNMYNFSDYSIISYSGKNINIVSDGQVNVAGSSSTALGQKDQNLGVMYDKKSKFIDIIKGVIPVPAITASLNKAKQAKQKVLPQTTFFEPQEFVKLNFKFLKTEKYDGINPNEDAIPSTLTQQDDLLTGLWGLSDWTEKQVDGTYPYPGDSLFDNFYKKAEKPNNLEANNMGQDYSNKADSSSSPPSISIESLNSYKVK